MVTRGDTLLLFDQSEIDDEVQNLTKRRDQLLGFIRDLEQLIRNEPALADGDLGSSLYQIQLLRFRSSRKKLQLQKSLADQQHHRQKILYEKQAISAMEYEQYQADVDRLKAELELLAQDWKNQWQESLVKFKDELQQLNLKERQVNLQRTRFVLLAPESGELHHVTNTTPGQYLAEGQKIAELSVQGQFIATCWIPPKDIGLLKPEMSGKFRVDSFNSNEWGFLTGAITGISSDAYFINNKPFFRVDCALDEHTLTLENGFIGKLKKGMTFQAHFKIAKRSLWDLLYDKADDWLNPSRS